MCLHIEARRHFLYCVSEWGRDESVFRDEGVLLWTKTKTTVSIETPREP